MDFVRPPFKTVADAIREEVTEEVTASVTKSVTEEVTKSVTASVTKLVTEEVTKSVTEEVTYRAIVKALKCGKLTLQEIAEYNSVSVDRVLKIQGELGTRLAAKP